MSGGRPLLAAPLIERRELLLNLPFSLEYSPLAGACVVDLFECIHVVHAFLKCGVSLP